MARLAAKPGVRSTLILSKIDGSVIRSTGLLAEPTASSTSPDNPPLGNTSLNGDGDRRTDTISNEDSGQGDPDNATVKGAESVARMVLSLVSGVQDCVEGMDPTDDMRLLRLRTRKSEIVIVPGQYTASFKDQNPELLTGLADPKFLLVVIHDAPQA